MKEKIVIITMFLSLVALNVFDSISTKILVIDNGFAEANPFINWMIQTFGFYSAVVFKAAVLLYMGWLLIGVMKQIYISKYIYLFLVIANLWYFILLYNHNFKYLMRLTT